MGLDLRHFLSVSNEFYGFPHVSNNVLFRFQDPVVETPSMQEGLAVAVTLAQWLKRRFLPS